MNAKIFIDALSLFKDPKRAGNSQRFFKTGPGEYGEGDIFIGVRVPDIRTVCKEFRDMPLNEVRKLLESQIHECRLAAVIILCGQFKRGSEKTRREIYDLYIAELEGGKINNWDIVDTSAGKIVGEYLRDTDRKQLQKFAWSRDLWTRRVAIIASGAYIETGESQTTIEISKILLHDTHDLIHKAVGWMLREVGKRVDEADLTDFLEEYAAEMPRTMLRYACERLTTKQRERYYHMRSKVLPE